MGTVLDRFCTMRGAKKVTFFIFGEEIGKVIFLVFGHA